MPWLVVLTFLLWMYSGGFDCVECTGTAVAFYAFAFAALGFVAVIAAGPVVWLARRRRRGP